MEFVGIALSGKGQGLTAFRHCNNCSLAVRCQDAVKEHAGDSKSSKELSSYWHPQNQHSVITGLDQDGAERRYVKTG